MKPVITFSPLEPGDVVELIAPASRCSGQRLSLIKKLLHEWQLNCIISDHLFGDDLLCANTDEMRYQNLIEALQRDESKALICVRGGYGTTRLMSKLSKLPRARKPKILLGMSDLTALHLFLNQAWQWPTLHGCLSVDHLSQDSIAAVKAVLFHQVPQVMRSGLVPLNEAAQRNQRMLTQVIGGNLTLLQASVGTSWQFNAKRKLILIEEVGERAYRIDRMLCHLMQANSFEGADGIVFGDFLEGEEPDGSSLIEPVLLRFAQQCPFPVLKTEGIGHGAQNAPIPFGMPTVLDLSSLSLCIDVF